jgi:hypothetical protein
MAMLRTLLWLLLFPLALGCGGSKLPPMEKVTGVVKYDGKPLTRGIILFEPDPAHGKSGPSAIGTIGPDGRYELTTDKTKGAMIGFHRVGIESRAEPKDHTDTLPKSLIPEKYTLPTTSGITKEVVKGKANEINIDLPKEESP